MSKIGSVLRQADRLHTLRSTAWVWIPVAFALALRLAFVDATPNYLPITHDDSVYDQLSCRISQFGYYPPYRLSLPDQASAYRPPVYPFVLGGIDTLTGCDAQGIPSTVSVWPRIIGELIGAAAVALVAWLAARWWGRRAGFAAGMLAAIFAGSIMVGSELLSEQLFTTLLLTAIVATVRVRETRGRNRVWWLIAAGTAAGLMALTRANGIALIPVLAAGTWVGHPRWSWRALAPPVALIAVAALTIAPWTLRNLRDMHGFIPVSDEAGGTLVGTYNDFSRLDPEAPASWHRTSDVPALQPLLERSRRVQMPEDVLQGKLETYAIDYARAHPSYILTVGYQNSLRLLGLAGHPEFVTAAEDLQLPDWSALLAWATATYCALLALVGVVTGAARRSPRFVWVVGLLLAVTTVFVNADAIRFQVPLGPFEALLGGAAVAWLLDHARSSRPV